MEDSALNALYQEGGGLCVGAPPINNACLPTIYDKLDSDARSKVKVVNRMLDRQRVVQEKIIYKYKDEALRMLQHNKSVVEKDLKRILRKYPDMDEMQYLSLKVSLNTNKQKRENRLGKFKAYSTEAIGMKGLSSDRQDDPFCDRYYGHHLGGCGRRGTRKLAPLPVSDSKEKRPHPLLLSKRLSVSDNILRKNKFHLFRGYNQRPVDEDAMTV